MMSEDDTYQGDRVLVTIISQPKPHDIADPDKKLSKVLLPHQGGRADKDYLLLYKTFEEDSNVKIQNFNLGSGTDIEKYIREIEAEHFDKFVFVFLTYKGREDGLIHVSDSDNYEMSKIYKTMTGNTGMGGKPKVILIQADDLIILQGMEDWSEKGGTKPFLSIIPSDTDRLVITSNIPQPRLQSSSESFLIRAFCEVVKQNRENNKPPVDFSIDVNCKVKEYLNGPDFNNQYDRISSNFKIPLVFSSLTKDLTI